MQIGLPPEPGNRFATGYFYHRAVIGAYVTAERSVEEVAPVDISIAELSSILCGRLVRIAHLEVDAGAAGSAWAQTLPSPTTGYVKFRTAAPDLSSVLPVPSADSITVITSGYASFASAPVPQGKVTLTGILFYGRGEGPRDHFLLKLRNEKDIAY